MALSNRTRLAVSSRRLRLAAVALLWCASGGLLFSATSFYSTTFPLTENPMRESGHWLEGHADGLNFSDVRTTPGKAFGTETGDGGGGYDDSTAILAGVNIGDQFAEAVVYNGNTSDQGFYEEVELRLRSTITPHSSTGYECFFSAAAKTGEFAYAQIARWDGANGNYTIIGQGGHNGSAYAIKTGDIVRCTAVGNQITAYINGVVVQQATDSRYATGAPGMGFFLLTLAGANPSLNANFGFSSWQGGALGSTAPPAPPTNVRIIR
jgi:hypothetical protein